MWKNRTPDDSHKENVIAQRDESIRKLIDELVDGTQELKSLYSQKEKNDADRNQNR